MTEQVAMMAHVQRGNAYFDALQAIQYEIRKAVAAGTASRELEKAASLIVADAINSLIVGGPGREST